MYGPQTGKKEIHSPTTSFCVSGEQHLGKKRCPRRSGCEKTVFTRHFLDKMLKRIKQRCEYGPPRSPEETTSLQESIREARRHLERIPEEQWRELRSRMRHLRDVAENQSFGQLSAAENRRARPDPPTSETGTPGSRKAKFPNPVTTASTSSRAQNQGKPESDLLVDGTSTLELPYYLSSQRSLSRGPISLWVNIP